jgi:hypothetical protein
MAPAKTNAGGSSPRSRMNKLFSWVATGNRKRMRQRSESPGEKRISPLCRSQEARAASVEMTVAEVGRGQKVSVEIFRLERAGEWRKAETLGILRCAQDDSRDLVL